MINMTNKKGPGRPALPDCELRRINLGAMVTPPEAEALRKDAESLGVSLSTYLRLAMLEKLKRSQNRNRSVTKNRAPRRTGAP